MTGVEWEWRPTLPAAVNGAGAAPRPMPAPPYEIGGPAVATREAYGAALEALAKSDERVVGVDGDVGNSTFTTTIARVDARRLLQGHIAEQNMIGVAMGLACRGKIPFASSFACFLSRGYDFMRMAAISETNVKLVGTHAGISIGEDGASQMGPGRPGNDRRATELHGALSFRRDQRVARHRVGRPRRRPRLRAHGPAEDRHSLRRRREVRNRQGQGAAAKRQ